MKIDRKKLELAMARACMTTRDVCAGAGLNQKTGSSILHGKNCKPITAGKIARALKVDVLEIIEMETSDDLDV